MTESHDPAFAKVQEAASFAARAHRHQVRKDGRTPYTAHPFRVCLVVRHVFGHDDPRMLQAALLHDTIEDTTTDYDDLAERFGVEVASWVSALTKDKSLPDPEREAKYVARLSAAPWQVRVCKLADLYDNLSDSVALSHQDQVRSLARSEQYLTVLQATDDEHVSRAAALVETLLQRTLARVSSGANPAPDDTQRAERVNDGL